MLLINHPIAFTYKVKLISETSQKIGRFLTEYSETEDWDHDEKARDFESMYEVFFNCMNRTGSESIGLKEALEVYKTRGKRSNMDPGAEFY
jgi:hypothetical protein